MVKNREYENTPLCLRLHKAISTEGCTRRVSPWDDAVVCVIVGLYPKIPTRTILCFIVPESPHVRPLSSSFESPHRLCVLRYGSIPTHRSVYVFEMFAYDTAVGLRILAC